MRQRTRGIVPVQIDLPMDQAERLRIARRSPGFEEAFRRLLDEVVVDLRAWPTLRELAWNRKDRWIPADEALGIYERNWRFVEPERITAEEAAFIERLKHRYGAGVMNV